ncbi:hypothetical protein GGI20_003792 [Coemansia sp. BCRC 34301]|nr:hypothetical protein GGI20_003792 [Coemansia sp. BCRC 34301]
MAAQVGGMVEYAADTSAQWYFSKEDMRNTPSVTGSDYSMSAGKSYSPAEEHSQRLRGCNFVHNVVKRLDMHQFVASTACVFFHRFYMRQSMSRYHHYEVAGACVLLSSKVEENKRGLKDIALACSYVAKKGNAKGAAEDREKWEHLLKRLEIVVLENCCFDMDVVHPYRYVDTLAPEFGIPVYIAKSATALINDSMRTHVCLLYRPEVVAVAALYLALQIHGHALDGGRSLFESRHVRLPANGVRLVEECMADVLDFYRREIDSEKEAHRQHLKNNGASGRPRLPHYT